MEKLFEGGGYGMFEGIIPSVIWQNLGKP